MESVDLKNTIALSNSYDIYSMCIHFGSFVTKVEVWSEVLSIFYTTVLAT